MKSICVIIPAKDEKLVIGRTIQSILASGIPPPDIYVADDGSSDKTGAIARTYGVNVLRNDVNIGKARSIKRMANYFQLADRYKYITLMDADTRVNADYFEIIKKGFRENKDAAVVCGQVKSSPHNWLTAYRCFAYFTSHLIYKSGQSKMGVITVAPGCSTTYRADIFPKLEWKNDTIVEDMDVTIQVHRKKLGRIVYQSKAVVHTQDPETAHDYIRQMYRWHTGTWQIGRKYKMLTGMAKIDWEYKLLMGEGLVFAAFFLLTPLWLVLYPKILLALAVDIAATIVMSLFAGLANKRKDVIFFSPFFFVLRFMDCGIFWYSFWNTIVRRQKKSGWITVARYANERRRDETTNSMYDGIGKFFRIDYQRADSE